MLPPPTMNRRARFACTACRRLKRKCPKELPSCSLCLRLGKPCGYPPRARDANAASDLEPGANFPTPDATADLRSLSDSPIRPQLGFAENGASEQSHDNAFPAMYFLDSEAFTKLLPSDCHHFTKIDTLSPDLPLEAHMLYERYFSTIHPWLPILSKKRIRRSMLDSGLAADGVSTLLFLCMKLVSEPLLPGTQAATNQPYGSVQELLLKVENTCLPSLQLLQSVILISVYEICHAIYPAAYLRVGHAARLSIMMGFHDRKHAAQLFKGTVTWTAREEERRTFWAVFCLDRIINQGVNGLPLSAPEPSPGELLPSPEAQWDEGAIGFNEPLFASSFSDNTSLGSFANVCQAAHVLGRVLRHRDEMAADMAPSFRIPEARQLHSILASLSSHLHSISGEAPPPASIGGSLPVATALCFSARLILYDIYACNERYSTNHNRSAEEAGMQREAMAGILDVVKAAWKLARGILDSVKSDAGARDRLSPLMCHCLYAAAAQSEWLILEHEDSDAATWLQDTVGLLQHVGKRWQVAGECVIAIRLFEL
ncbi:hypothetical protein F4779DRAFT_142393 [Xylariaceae sp. FL0662B]|nr:hypothetical protein F4779DRAFT_142393 [Xylariaceae sp. FL0662B]